MSPAIATVVCIVGILGLFWLDRDPKAQTSAALWIAVAWVSLACSRSVSQWLQLGQPMNSMNAADVLMEGSPLDRSVYTGLLFLGLIVLANRGRKVWNLLRSNAPILLFFFYCLVSIVWSDYPDVAFKRWTKALGDLVMVLVVLSDSDMTVAIRRLLARITYVLIPLSILFIKYYPDIGREYGRWAGEVHYIGVTNNKNTLGVVCLLFGLGTLWRLLSAYSDREDEARTRRLFAHCVVLAMVFWLFWITNSMTSLACFLMAGSLLLATSLRAVIRRPRVVHLLVAAVVSVSASVLFLGVDPGLLETMGRNPTLTDRTEIWSLVLSLPSNPFFGTGFESFWLGPRLQQIWSVYSWGPTEAHNGYIEIFLTLGWAGIALLAVVLATGYRKVVAAWRRNAGMGSLMLAYFVVGVTYNFTEAAFFRMMAPAWIFFLMAMTVVLPISNRRLRPAAQYSNRLNWEPAPSTLSEELV